VRQDIDHALADWMMSREQAAHRPVSVIWPISCKASWADYDFGHSGLAIRGASDVRLPLTPDIDSNEPCPSFRAAN